MSQRYLIERCVFVYKRYADLLAERLQIVHVRLVTDIAHAHIYGRYANRGLVNFRLTTKQLCQSQRVLAATESYQHMVAVL